MVLGAAVFLLPAGASARVDVPGDTTPPEVTLVLHGTQERNGWYVTTVTLNWIIQDPESIILETIGCNARTLTTDTAGSTYSCYARSDGGETTKDGHDQGRRDRTNGHRHPLPRT